MDYKITYEFTPDELIDFIEKGVSGRATGGADEFENKKLEAVLASIKGQLIDAVKKQKVEHVIDKGDYFKCPNCGYTFEPGYVSCGGTGEEAELLHCFYCGQAITQFDEESIYE